MGVGPIYDIDAAAHAVLQKSKRVLQISDEHFHGRRAAEKTIFLTGVSLGKQLGHTVFAVYGIAGKPFFEPSVQFFPG